MATILSYSRRMPSPTIAYFVTPHGLGHASRSAAVMEALGRREQDVAFEIVTTVPEWFFSQSLSIRHRVLPVVPGSAEEGDWHRQIERLLAPPAGIEQQHNGADEIADLLLAHLR